MVNKNIFIYHLDYEIQKLFELHSTYENATIYKCFNIATRLAYLLTEKNVLIPISNYLESDIAFSIVNNFQSLNEFGEIELISSSKTFPELLEKKQLQHSEKIAIPNYHYMDFLNSDKKMYLPGNFLSRTGSASIDIINAWNYKINNNEVFVNGLYRLSDNEVKASTFEDSLFLLPENLNGKAFISDYVLPLLPINASHKQSANFILNAFITSEYINSFLKEYDAVCLKDIPLIDTKAILPLEGERNFISYKHYIKKLKSTNYKRINALEYINNCSAEELFYFKESKTWRNIDIENNKSYYVGKRNKEMNNEDVKIGILTALPKEFAAMKTLIENPQNANFEGAAGNRYVIGDIPAINGKTHKVALGLLPDMGNNIASIVATLMQVHFKNINHIIMTGIAGGAPTVNDPEKDIHLGDIAISDRGGVFQYDYVKEGVESKEVRSPVRPPDAELIEAVRYMQADEISGETTWRKNIDMVIGKLTEDYSRPNKETDILHDENNKIVDRAVPNILPKLYTGKIASANSLQKNPFKRIELSEIHNCIAVEMEGSGIADSAWMARNGYLIIRGICDYCDPYKNNIWQNYAAATAAAYTKALIENIKA